MKPQQLIDSVKQLKSVLPYAFVLGAIYQLVQLSTFGLIELFSWTQVINDTLIILPLLLIIAIIYFAIINSIKQFQQGDFMESGEWFILACLVVVYMVLNGYESLRGLILGFSAAIVFKYIFDSILIEDQDHIIGYTKFYNKALILMPYICAIALIIIGVIAQGKEFTGLHACIQQETNTPCITQKVAYMNDKYVVTHDKAIFPLDTIYKFTKD